MYIYRRETELTFNKCKLKGKPEEFSVRTWKLWQRLLLYYIEADN